ncbi:VOC family protein [Novosphingobium clariflavum]|uniref:VOC family protein n=1 Tax=Novosphingobium clariflavum TaxID=2029884 RepID=A0ABV6S6H2_9SPHN|nr:VOC family protein [Novosphingobium clariflavum]
MSARPLLAAALIVLCGAATSPAPEVHAAPQGTAPGAASSGDVNGMMVGPALYVSDPAASARFYTEGLGMKVRLRFGPPDRPDQLVGYGAGMTQPSIMLLSEKAGSIARIEHGHGFDRIAFQISGLEQIAARLRKAGYQPGPIEKAHGTMQVMMVTDPDGYRLELVDPAPAGPPPTGADVGRKEAR